MFRVSSVLILVVWSLALGCSTLDEEGVGDAGSPPEPADVAASDTGSEPEADVGPPPEPGPLRASVATVRLFAPLGISTAGYGQDPDPGAPKSPYATVFQATTRLLHPPRAQVIHLTDGVNRLVLIQTDLIGIQGRVVDRLLQRVDDLAGEDLAGQLVLMANHTHSSVGHLFTGLIAMFVADIYDEAVLNAVVDSIAAGVVSALSAEAVPVRVGYAAVQNGDLHSDRRCENPPYSNDRMGLMRIDTADGAEPLALVINYAMHPTVFGPGDAMLGGDAARAVELGVAEALPAAAMVMFVQSWAGDMSPGDPRALFQADPPLPPASMPAYDRLDALGRSAAESVLAAWDEFEWLEEPTLAVRTAQRPLNPAALGYADDEFPHPTGAALCGLGAPTCGDAPPPDMGACFVLPEGEAPTQVRLTAARIGDLALITLPGEPVTSLGEYAVDRTLEATGARAVLLLGYAQEHLGYLLVPEDWYAGGYEPTMSFWGPKQGVHVAEGVASIAGTLFDDEAELAFSPRAPLPFVPGQATGMAATPSASFGDIASDLPPQATAGDELVFEWTGGDPWVDSPRVRLEVQPGDDGDPVPALALAGTLPIDDAGDRIWLQVSPQPPWTEPADVRQFVWRARLRTGIGSGGPAARLQGRYRLVVEGVGLTVGAAPAPYSLASGVVEIGP